LVPIAERPTFKIPAKTAPKSLENILTNALEDNTLLHKIGSLIAKPNLVIFTFRSFFNVKRFPNQKPKKLVITNDNLIPLISLEGKVEVTSPQKTTTQRPLKKLKKLEKASETSEKFPVKTETSKKGFASNKVFSYVGYSEAEVNGDTPEILLSYF
jgi:hypothetical protein